VEEKEGRIGIEGRKERQPDYEKKGQGRCLSFGWPSKGGSREGCHKKIAHNERKGGSFGSEGVMKKPAHK